MIPIIIKITKVNWWPGSTPSERRETYTKVFYSEAEDYWLHYTRLHFNRGAYSRYGFRPRQGDAGGPSPYGPNERKHKSSYMFRKWKKFHHHNPLEFTGDTKKRALEIRGVRANSRRGWLVAYVPNLNRRPWCWEEYTRITGGEATSTIATGQRKLDEIVRRYRNRTTTVITGGV